MLTLGAVIFSSYVEEDALAPMGYAIFAFICSRLRDKCYKADNWGVRFNIQRFIVEPGIKALGKEAALVKAVTRVLYAISKNEKLQTLEFSERELP